MLNRFCKVPLWEAAKTLAAVAQGREKADLVIKNARLVNVCTAEILENVDVAVAAGRVAYIGEAEHCVGAATRVLEAGGQYIAPGFLDGHIHIESSMLTAAEYARAVVPHGTVGIYADPHEITNVLGLDALKVLDEDARRTPLKTMFAVPSCVPAVEGFEDSGAAVGPAEIREAMKWERAAALGEMMNFPGVLAGDDKAHQEIAETLKAGKVVTGHYAADDTDRGLNAYISCGICCCHEATRSGEALARMRLGMYAQIREGSAWRDLKALAKDIVAHPGPLDTRFACLVSDDTHPNTLYRKGHLDHILRRAVAEGIDVIRALQMITINTASCYRMDNELGSITPGKCADIVFLNNLTDLQVTRVIIDGEIAAEDGRPCFAPSPFTYPAWATNTIHISAPLQAASFAIPALRLDGTTVEDGETLAVRVLDMIPGALMNRERLSRLPAAGGLLQLDPAQDILKAFVFERHRATGTCGAGLVSGFAIKNGALASTVAHDAHNLIVIGTQDEDMALAANTLIEAGGGMTACQNGKVLGLVPLPIAGLMNGLPVEEMAALVDALEEALPQTGCAIPNPFLTLAFLSMACLPSLRLTNRGLVDSVLFRMTSLAAE